MAIFDLSKIETGDVLIESMDLIKLDGSKYSIYAQFVAASIYEDLFNPIITAEFKMHDELSILKRFPIIGKEYINLNFQTPGITSSYNLNLYVYAITDIKVNESSNWAEYTIKACSKEALMNNQITMDKYYLTTIDQIIQDVLSNYIKTSKPLYLSGTQGIQHIVPARISPFEFIDIMKARAKSPSKASSSYVFFENRDGFYFTTLEDLIQKGALSSPKTYYKHTALTTKFQNEWSHWDIIDYSLAQEFNILDNIKLGSYQGLMESFDLHTKTFYTNKYNVSQFGQYINLDTGTSVTQPIINPPGTGIGSNGQPILLPIPFNVASVINPTSVVITSDNIRSVPAADVAQYSTDVGLRYYNIGDSYRPSTFIEQMLPNKFGFLGVTLTSLTDIYINGDTSSTVGDVFNIQMLKADKLTDQPPNTPDFLTNGPHLSIRIRHNLLNSHKKPKYTQIVTLARPTYSNMPTGGLN